MMESHDVMCFFTFSRGSSMLGPAASTHVRWELRPSLGTSETDHWTELQAPDVGDEVGIDDIFASIEPLLG